MKFRARTKRPRIAVDYDGILLPTYEAIVEWSDRRFGTSFGPFRRKAWPDHWMRRVWGRNAAKRADQFDHDYDKNDVVPVGGAVEALSELDRNYEIVVITSGTASQRRIKQRWLRRHFPMIKQTIFIDERGRYPTKAAACKKLVISAIIEDRYDYAKDCADAGVEAIIIDRYEWSQGPKTERVTHVASWPEAKQKVSELIKD